MRANCLAEFCVCVYVCARVRARKMVNISLALHQMFGEGLSSARGATAILAAATTLETCWEGPFTRAVATNYFTTVAIMQ